MGSSEVLFQSCLEHPSTQKVWAKHRKLRVSLNQLRDYRKPCLRKEKREGGRQVSECREFEEAEVTDSLVDCRRGEPRKSPSEWKISCVIWDRGTVGKCPVPLCNSQRAGDEAGSVGRP